MSNYTGCESPYSAAFHPIDNNLVALGCYYYGGTYIILYNVSANTLNQIQTYT